MKLASTLTRWLFLFLVLVLNSLDSPAQTSAFKVDDNSSVNLLNLNTDAGFLVKGLFGTGAIPATGLGTRFMWYPTKAAFRVGSVDGTQWDAGSVGDYSLATGYNTTASGPKSTAMGQSTTASGNSTTAMGYNTTASGDYSTAMGYTTTASGFVSTAMGQSTTASGNSTTAMGYNTWAYGDFSTAMGNTTIAQSYGSLAIGRFNVGAGTTGSWITTDPLFEIGIGTGAGSKANAMTVLKNGNVGIGIAAPDALLHVAGQVKVTGGSPGAGKVLTSDAVGLATWQTPTVGDITTVGSMTSGDVFNSTSASGQWLGLGASAGRIEFDDQTVDEVNFLNAKVGIGTSTPSADLHVSGTEGLLAQGTYASGAAQSLGAGTRLHWYPFKAAFRAGYVTGTQWDDANIGTASTAMGKNTTASGSASTAMGFTTTASGTTSTAMGYITTASGDYSTAMGYGTTASGTSSTAMGHQTIASGTYSTAMGWSTTASGNYSTAMGNNTTASGITSTAMGYNTTASGNYSTAIGYQVSTNNHPGSCIISDASTATTTNSSADWEMTMRFQGGYRLFTKGDLSTGVSLAFGATSWGTISDRNKKENFKSIDGESILSRVRSLPVTEWNYKANDPSVRYIGPMAQDFHASFHLAGEDSLTITTLAMDGVLIASVQALEKRTREQKTEIDLLQAQVKDLKRDNTELYSRIDRIESMLKSNGKVLYSSAAHSQTSRK